MTGSHVTGKPYPEQCRKDAADFVLAAGRTIGQCAEGPGVNDKAPSGWVADRKRGPGEGGTARLRPAGPQADPELAAARKGIGGLGPGNDFSRKAAACSARGLARSTGTRPCGWGGAAAPCP